jgi:uncharacterized protein (TIGR03086 family)
MDAIQQTNAAIDMLTPLVEATSRDQLTNATPCAKWTVADLLNHFVGGGHMFAASLRGAPLDMDGEPQDLLGEDHVAAYRTSIADFRDAVAGLESLEQPAVLPIGTVPAEIALRIAAGDLLVHSWDLATATGQAFEPSDELVAEIDGFYRIAINDELRDGDTFASEVELPADATALDRLVAFAGRQP